MRGIATVGRYLPRYEISSKTVADSWGQYNGSGIKTKRVPTADEDVLTMAVAAAESAIDHSSFDVDTVSSVHFATTSPPLEEEELIPRFVRMLGLSETISARTFTQSTRSGAPALSTALQTDGVALVIAADAPRGDPADIDHPFGAGAAAFLITDSAQVEHLETATVVDELPGIRYREQGTESVEELEITSYERSEIKRCVTEAISQFDRDVDDIAAAAIHQPDARFPSRIISGTRIDETAVNRGIIADQFGDVGAAGVPLALTKSFSAIDRDERTLAIFFGSGGGVTAMLFCGAIDNNWMQESHTEEISYSTYLRNRGYIGTIDVSGGGAHVSLPSWRRTLDQRYRLVAGRCPECSGLAFPPEGTCPECHCSVEFEQVELPRQGTIRAVTVIGQGGAPPEFTEQQRRNGEYGVAIIEVGFAKDDSITLPAQLTDTDPTTVAVGDDVRALIRRIYTQEGVPRYGVKFSPVES
ncbi:3-hydroxy-3-methylglutaryl CoA synthase [Haladaptatus caseinilyticus]|uniref:3-hydroxy-3-methylglutaryl CoA synthase n=1 Tax=Haladaptatus caseinilyticus TaxID=2993314 RepID=UPI00224A55F3|nr:3-hydroxy-3-methylglutaryl CoA synthase [Haladaptatus caseinilyticus]